jgi:hypothetical protein
MEGCLWDLGEGGRPRSSLKLWRCCAEALGMLASRRDGDLPGGDRVSERLERGVLLAAGEEGEREALRSRFGVAIVLWSF